MADIRSGIQTDEVLELEPYGFRVTWIDWDSSFRTSGLEIGDLIVALDGVPYTAENRQETAPRAVGQYHESSFWQERGSDGGDEIVLGVLRLTPDETEERLDIRGTLLGEGFYKDSQDRTALGPGGPPRRSTSAEDGRLSNWAGWYEELVKRASYVLDGGWDRGSFNNRRELADHLEERERIDYLLEHYPGPFADAAAADWDRVRAVLEGERVALTDEDLAYRELGERRRDEVREVARAGWDRFLEELEPETIPTFPAVDPIRGDREAVAGKVVVFPWITPRGGLVERFGRSYAVAGSAREGFYFAPLDAPEMQRFFDAYFRYRAKVDPGIAERYRFVARILDDPVLLTADGRPAPGLLVQVIGGGAGAGDGDLFVDLREPLPVESGPAREVGRSPFAGEEALAGVDVPEVADDASPAEVVTAMIQAVKWADEATWRSVFADWRLFSRFSGPPIVDVAFEWSESNLTREWGEARKQIQDAVYDVRVARVDRVRTLREPGLDDGGPAVDQVDVFVDHVGFVDGEYRTFVDTRVHRRWRLQRLDGGPWRVSELRRL